MDRETEEEIESIWERTKKYIDVNQIKGVSKSQIQAEIRRQLENVSARGKNPQSNADFLISKGFPKEASKNEKIRRELLTDNIVAIKVRGRTRFQVARGTPTVVIDGKQIRAGQFLAGKTEEEAIKNLEQKVD